MLEMRLEPISSVNDVEEAAAIAQLKCIFTSEFDEADFDWDDDAMFQSFIEALREEGDEETASYMETEPSRAVQNAKERLLSDVRSLLRKRLRALGDHAPFHWSMRGSRLLERKALSEIDGVGAAYLWFSLFDLSESDRNYLQIDPDEYKQFRRIFDDVFEVVTCYALAGRQEQHTWYVGKQRSTAEFLKFLTRVTRRAKSGKVKPYNDLDANQKSVNDAGVDGIGLGIHHGKIGSDSVLIFVQATIQKTNRRIKLFGADEVKRIKAFFTNNPRAAALGALAIPYEGTEIDKANCAEQDCIYITRDEIYKFLGHHPVPGPRSGTPYLDAVMAKHNRQHVNKARLLSVDGPLAIA